MTTDFTQPAPTGPEIKRDRWGRPLIPAEGGGKPKAYTRCTTFVDALSDSFGLSKWKMRMVLLGAVDRPDLILSASASREDKQALDRFADAALEAAGAGKAASIGTALHSLTERMDRTEALGEIPEAYRADLAAYAHCVGTNYMVMESIEQFVVHDGYEIGGTPDRLIRMPDGKLYIGDLKTGSLDHSSSKIAMQMSVYSRSRFLDIETGVRTDLHGVDQDRGIILHMPAGSGTCTPYWVDLDRGWHGVELCQQVRNWRKIKKMHTPFVEAHAELAKAQMTDPDSIVAQIQAADTHAALVAIWRDNKDAFTDAHTLASKRRLEELGAK